MTWIEKHGRPFRIAAGIALVLHGLAHAVLAYRGAGGGQASFGASNAVMIFYSVAMVCFVAAGVGVAGSRFQIGASSCAAMP